MRDERLGRRVAGESSADLERGGAAADRLFMEISDILGIFIILFGALVLLRRGISGVHPEFEPHTHWTQGISGGRWSAVAATGFAVSVVAALEADWLLAVVAGLGGLVAAYATLAQVRRRRF